jgi:hypothetical protein
MNCKKNSSKVFNLSSLNSLFKVELGEIGIFSLTYKFSLIILVYTPNNNIHTKNYIQKH